MYTLIDHPTIAKETSMVQLPSLSQSVYISKNMSASVTLNQEKDVEQSATDNLLSADS